MKTTVLVTGGAGFIGAHVCNHLLKKKWIVVVIDDLSGGFIENIPEEAIFHQGSITDNILVNNIFEKYNFDYVYHLAAYAAEGLSHFIRRFNYQNNLIGSTNLINASVNHNVNCFIYTSSIAVYGENTVPLSEDQIPQPEDPYGIAKYAVELDLKAAHKLFGLNYCIFRPHNVYGPLQNINDKYRNVIGIFMKQLFQNKALTVFGNGEQTRAFSYIDDVAPHIANAATHKAAYSKIINIGSDSFHSVRQVADLIQRSMQKKTGITHLDAREEVVHAYADHTLFKRIFPEHTVTSLEEGIQKMVVWASTLQPQETTVFDKIEIRKNLPNSWQ